MILHNATRDMRLAVRASMPIRPIQGGSQVNTTMANPVINPKTVTWTWPSTGKDQNGNAVSISLADLVALEVQFDGGSPIDVTSVTGNSGANGSLVLTTLPAYQALSVGTHTIDIAARTAEGSVGVFSAPLTFLIGLVPDAPTAVALA